MPSNPKRKGVSTRASTKRRRGPANPPITPQTASNSVGQSPLTNQPSLVSQPSLSNQPSLVSQPLLTNQPSSISQPSLTNQPSLASQTSLTNQPAIFSQPSLTNQPSVVSQPSFPQPVYVNPPQAPLGFANQPWLPQTVSQPVHTVVCVPQPLPNQAQALASGTLPVLPQSASYQSGEADPIPLLTYNDHDIFISEVTRNKIWNGEYVKLALLLKQNFSSTQSVSGTLAIIDNQLSIKPATSKIKQPINSIEMWSDAFINFILVYIQKHIAKASDLLRYMAVIRGAAVNNPISKWLVYDMQFRLRTSKDPNRSWSQIDGHLWLSCGLSGDLSTTCQGNAPCYEYNFKGSCTRMLCNYAHVCIRCKVPHPASSCNLFNQRSIQPRFNYGQNRPAGNHCFAVTDPSTGARPPRPNFGNFRPPRQPGNIRPFRQGTRPQTRFMGLWKNPY